MAQDELREAKEKATTEQQLQVLLLPKDPDDERNAFLEVRAGTGGDEAARLAIRSVYSRYAVACRWQNHDASEVNMVVIRDHRQN